METKKYDPLRILVKQNANEKRAYDVGFNTGFDVASEKEAHKYELEIVSWREWLYKRIIEVEDIRDSTENPGVFLRGMSPVDAYLAALADISKILRERKS